MKTITYSTAIIEISRALKSDPPKSKNTLHTDVVSTPERRYVEEFVPSWMVARDGELRRKADKLLRIFSSDIMFHCGNFLFVVRFAFPCPSVITLFFLPCRARPRIGEISVHPALTRPFAR